MDDTLPLGEYFCLLPSKDRNFKTFCFALIFQTFCDIKDISYGKENVVISCVNGIDRQYPDYVDYSNQRIPASSVKLNIDPEFLVCCDCTDNCQVR